MLLTMLMAQVVVWSFMWSQARMMTIVKHCQHVILVNPLTRNSNSGARSSGNTRIARSNTSHQYNAFVRVVAMVARLTEVVVGSELEVDGSREDDEKEVDVVFGDDVCDEDVRARAVEEVVGLGRSEEEESEEDTTGVVEEEKNTDEDARSLRKELLGGGGVVDVLTLTLVEVEAAVLLA